MQKYILCILVLVLNVTIGFGTKVGAETKEDYFNSGIAYYELGKHQQAIKDFNQAIRLDPKFAEAYNNRGIAYGKGKGQYGQAIADYTKAIELNPKYADAFYNRGIGYINLGKKDRACDDWRKACELGDCDILNWAKKEGVCQ